MAVYPQLLLSTGGGVISKSQQAKQVTNTASILIGLGGTGIDCIKHIKKAVYERLEPDEGKELAEYRHIQFLGVDTDDTVVENAKEDITRRDLSNLDKQTEFLKISVGSISDAMIQEYSEKVYMNPHLNWLNPDISVEARLPGAGGIRQAGRLMMMEHSTEFSNKVKQIIDTAKDGLKSPAVNIHIFSGIGGGTGSGTFLDVCYLVKKIADQSDALVYSYFLLPDVNLSKIDPGNELGCDAIKRNGYAAMQELDYCMGLNRDNCGKTFSQIYKNGEVIAWNKAPVDMCHLITATDMDGNFIENAYENSMNVTTEYVMDFLTEPDDAEHFGIRSHQSNFAGKVKLAESGRRIGRGLAYCIIGGACATIPMREINTYLASELFAKFSSLKVSYPNSGDLDKLVEATKLKYNDLEREIQTNLYGDFAPYPNSYKDVKDAGISVIGMITDYFHAARAEKANQLVKNAEYMKDAGNEESLIRRIRKQLDNYAAEYGKGPVFAYGLLEAAKKENLLNIIKGLKEQNDLNIMQASYENGEASKRYDKAVQAYRIKQKKGTFEALEVTTRALVKTEFECRKYDEIAVILDKLEEQIRKIASQYYLILSRVFCNLINTFDANQKTLSSKTDMTVNNSFSKPIVTIQDKNLQEVLNKRIEKIDPKGVMNSLIHLLLNNEEEWIQEDNLKISKLVNEYLVTEAFSDFAGKTITDFLSIKYGTDNFEIITERLKEEEIEKLNASATPLFYIDRHIWPNELETMQFISIPTSAPVVVGAAKKVFKKEEIKASALTDRLYVMKMSAVLPLAAYKECNAYERTYFRTKGNGCHYYEGLHDTPNWGDLAPITPVSKYTIDEFTPIAMRENLKKSEEMYEIAVQKKLLLDNRIRSYSEESVNQLKEKNQSLRQIIDSLKERKDDKTKAMAITAKEELERAIQKMELVDTEYTLRTGSTESKEVIESVRKDFFYSAYEIQRMMRSDVELVKEAEESLKEAEDILNELGKGDKEIEYFCRALFTGIFNVDGLKIIYEKEEFGIPEEVILTKFGKEFPYCKIPLYQAFLTYQTLPEDEVASIEKEADTRLDSGDDSISDAADVLKGLITKEYNGKMAENARSYATEYQTIVSFIKRITMELSSLINLFGV